MPARSSKVNLIPPSEFESGFWGSFLKWAVTTGRYLIILTEMVVIVAFLMRFKLDEDLRNLNEQINGQVALLQSQAKKEERFRELQNKIQLTDKLLEAKIHPVSELEYLDERVPEEMTVKERKVFPGGILITATTLSQGEMGEFMATVSADSKWASVDVTSLSGDREKGITFTFTAKE